jgi:UDP-glucose 4-epimerase
MAKVEASRPVVVTGGAGAIGSVLVARLAERGHRVRVLDNLSSPLPGARERFAAIPRVRLRVADLRRLGSVESAFRNAEAVWHLAANPDIRRGTADPRVDFGDGVTATFNALEAARRNDVHSFVYASSSVVYGLPTRFPTPEDYGPLRPESIYGGSKLAGEGLVSAFCHSYGIIGHVFRFANIIGREMTHGVIFDFFEKLRLTPDRLEVLGDGRQAKSYLRVDDCVDGMFAALEHAREPLNIFNLGTEDQTTAREIAEIVVEAHGSRARIDYLGGERGWTGDVPRQLLDTARIRALGWKPRMGSTEAVRETVRELAQGRGIAPSG